VNTLSQNLHIIYTLHCHAFTLCSFESCACILLHTLTSCRIHTGRETLRSQINTMVSYLLTIVCICIYHVNSYFQLMDCIKYHTVITNLFFRQNYRFCLGGGMSRSYTACFPAPTLDTLRYSREGVLLNVIRYYCKCMVVMLCSLCSCHCRRC